MADLPDISQNLDDPLPQVDPNSALVPYRMSRTDPGGQPVVTTGYGPRARPPIQPPAGYGGGVGMPGLDQIYQAAFSKLPVEEAARAVEAATRYIGQRGYMADIQAGKNAAEAFTKWGPMLFRQATGIPEAIERTIPPPISPQQMIQNRLAQAKFDAAQAAAKAKADAATRMTPYQQAEIDLRKQAAAKPRPGKVATITVPLNPDAPDGAKITGPADDPDVVEAVKKHEDAIKAAATPAPKEPGMLEKAKDFLTGSKPKGVKTKEQYDALKSGEIYIGKDGKKYKKP